MIYPVLNEEFIELAKFIASNNFSYYAVALQTMIPTALKIKYQKVAKADIIPEELKNIFNGRKEVIVDNRPLDEQKLIYEAYEKGYFDKVVTTDLNYLPPELYSKPYFIEADMSKFVASLIDFMNHDASLSNVLTTADKIHGIVDAYNSRRNMDIYE